MGRYYVAVRHGRDEPPEGLAEALARMGARVLAAPSGARALVDAAPDEAAAIGAALGPDVIVERETFLRPSAPTRPATGG